MLQMTALEITFNVAVLLGTAGVLWYLHHLVKTSGTDPIEDPDLVQRFTDAAPYHQLDNIFRNTP